MKRWELPTQTEHDAITCNLPLHIWTLTDLVSRGRDCVSFLNAQIFWDEWILIAEKCFWKEALWLKFHSLCLTEFLCVVSTQLVGRWGVLWVSICSSHDCEYLFGGRILWSLGSHVSFGSPQTYCCCWDSLVDSPYAGTFAEAVSQ